MTVQSSSAGWPDESHPGQPAAPNPPPWAPPRRHAADPAPTWRELLAHWTAAFGRGVWAVLSHPIVTVLLIFVVVLLAAGCCQAASECPPPTGPATTSGPQTPTAVTR